MATHITHEEVKGTRFECRSGAVLTETLHDMGVHLNDSTVKCAIELLNGMTTAIVVKLNGDLTDFTSRKPMDGVVLFFDASDRMVGYSAFRTVRREVRHG